MVFLIVGTGSDDPHIGYFFKQPVKVFRRICRNLFQCLIPQFGNMFGSMTHKSRFVLPASFGNGGKERRIGFH